jgi:hypothetical protein
MRRHLLPLLVLCAAACASSGAAGRRPAHGGFARTAYDATWERALEILHAEGYEVGLADRQRGILMTMERELQAPCGEQQCLSRESVSLRLGTDGSATLSIHRQQWNLERRAFAEASDPRSVEAVERAQASLVQAITGRSADLRLSRKGESCADEGECEKGLGCYERRCTRLVRK